MLSLGCRHAGRVPEMLYLWIHAWVHVIHTWVHVGTYGYIHVCVHVGSTCCYVFIGGGTPPPPSNKILVVTVNVGRAGAASLDVIQEVEYVKQEAKIVYLLECLQKTAPPVSRPLDHTPCEPLP